MLLSYYENGGVLSMSARSIGDESVSVINNSANTGETVVTSTCQQVECESICEAVQEFLRNPSDNAKSKLLDTILEHIPGDNPFDAPCVARNAIGVRKNGARERFLKLEEVEARTGFRKSSIYKWMDEDGFPKSVKFGRSVRWLEADVDQWIEWNTKRQG